ncbi:MAG: TIGR02556 family CRISPR-associated protein [Fervidobacterium sp.]|uniref:TIGR02556 family CRISPR-associated protein n=1 Tax=Fervidobacterium sp. TaxID=1871331 RepID=UPI004049F63D
MLRGIVDIGRAVVSKQSGDIDSKIEGLIKRGQFDGIIRVIFKPNEGKITLFPEEFDEDKLRKYVWIGNNAGNKPQKRLTTDNLLYVFKSIQNIYNSIDKDSYPTLWYYLHEITSKFCLSDDLTNISYFEGMENLFEELNDSESDIKKVLSNFIKRRFGKKQVLFTAFINNGKELTDECIACTEDYKIYLLNEFQKKDTDIEIGKAIGNCHICGNPGRLRSEFKEFQMKFYINDKISFASGLTKDGFKKNYQLCDDCFEAFLYGERYVLNELKSKLGEADVYLIPEFASEISPVQLRDFERILRRIKLTCKALNTYQNWDEFRQEVKDRFEDNLVGINFLFAEKSNAAFKVKKAILDVSPSRIQKVIELAQELAEEISKIFPEEFYYLDFRTIFNLIPLRRDLFNEIYSIYEAILLDVPLSEKWIISQLLKTIRIRHFETYETYYTGSRSMHFETLIVFTNVFLMYLKRLNLLKGGGCVLNFEELSKLEEELAEYVKQSNFDEQKTSLFLLGTLVANIATEQYKSDQRKQILDIINYSGMPLSKIKNFVVQLHQKLRQYKVLNATTEYAYALAKQLIDKNESSWKLTPQENVYFILSGYAYKTKKIINLSKGGETNE